MEKENKNTENNNQSPQAKTSEKTAPYLAEISEWNGKKDDLELFSKEFNVNYRTVRYPKVLAAIVAVGFIFVLWKSIVVPDAPVIVGDRNEKLKEMLSKNKEVSAILYSLDPNYSESLFNEPAMSAKEKKLMEALARREALRKKLAEEKNKKK